VSKGRLGEVWLATEGNSSWAAMHVAWRHGARIEAVITLEVDVPRSGLRRSPGSSPQGGSGRRPFGERGPGTVASSSTEDNASEISFCSA